MFKAENDHKYQEIRRQVFLNKHKPQFIFDLILQNAFKPSRKFVAKYRKLQEEIKGLFSQLVYRGDPVHFLES